MEGQETKRVRPASSDARRNSRGTPPYSTQRVQRAEPQQGYAEASPTVPQGGRVLLIPEPYADGYVIEESLPPLSTGYTAANYAAPSTTSDIDPQISSYCSVSWDVVPPTSPPYPGTVEEPDPLSALTLATAPERYAPDFPNTFLAPTPVTNGTPAAATSTVFLAHEKKEPAASLCVEDEVQSTPDKAAAAGVFAAAATSEVGAPPQDVPVLSSPDLKSQAPPQLLTAPPQRQEQPLAAAQQDGNSPEKWTVEEVARFVAGVTGCERLAKKFRDHQIDGYALLLMKEHHLMMAMKMKLGMALKLCAIINSLRELP